MAVNPTMWGRMYARLQGEVPATTLEAYRRASLQVFQAMELAEVRRLECAADGLDPWTVPPGARAEFLCAWNAFVLQTLGNDILDADYDASPATAGFVPPLTASQVVAFYEPVEEWLSRAQQARANPDFRLEVQVPARLPEWKGGALEPAPRSRVEGIVRAMRSVGDHAGAAMRFLPETAAGPGQQAQLNRIRQIYAAAEGKARYALDLRGTGSTGEAHPRLEPCARQAIQLFYQLGQLIADPSLVEGPAPLPEPAARPQAPPPTPSAPRAASASRPGAPAPAKATAPPPAKAAVPPPPPPPPGPGQAGFNAWCLTDPEARAELQHNPRAQRALRRNWRLDPDPAQTLALHADIQTALARGHVACASSGDERLGYFNCCPWSPIYVANRAVTLGGTALEPMQRFVLDVGATNPDDTFQRRILVGSFQQAAVVQYGPHRDQAGGGRRARRRS